MSGAATGLRQAFAQGAVVGLARRRELAARATCFQAGCGRRPRLGGANSWPS